MEDDRRITVRELTEFGRKHQALELCLEIRSLSRIVVNSETQIKISHYGILVFPSRKSNSHELVVQRKTRTAV